MGCVYYHKNKINGHMYIGQSKCEPGTIKYGRWGANGQGYKANKYFWRAIQKYGWENFEHGFFEQNIPVELLNDKEKFYISKYHTYRQDPEYVSGYNLTPGGEGSMNTWWPEEDAWLYDNHSLNKTRDQLIEEYRIAFPDSYHSDAAIKARLKTLRLSDAKNINFWSEDENKKLIEIWYDAPQEEILRTFPKRNYETIRKQAIKLGLKRKLGYNLYSKQEEDILKQYYEDYGPEYCQKLIKEQCNINRSLNSVKDHAIKVLKLHCHIKFTGKAGFNLEAFAEYYKVHSIAETAIQFKITEEQVINIAHRNHFKRNKATIITGKTARAVYCIELAQTFKSVREAARILNISKGNISEVCHDSGTRKTAGGYHWRYIE